ncbi:EbsA family protein [Isobaculum melis]|uniref:PH domain-containing protein n=1 Tax=Isobaculum melis TaxID=142588 RepID=A0A1H9RWM8_9LACT|nr:EbsA family protein [Isobaculum melis]SER77087.1 hypothetical protein SAMN04488559_105141 [Isobaculum melis]
METKKNYRIFKLHFDWAYLIIYWSITISLLCFSISLFLEFLTIDVRNTPLFILFLVMAFLGTGFQAKLYNQAIIISNFRGIYRKKINLVDVAYISVEDKELVWQLNNQKKLVRIGLDEKDVDLFIQLMKEAHVVVRDNRSEKKKHASNFPLGKLENKSY